MKQLNSKYQLNDVIPNIAMLLNRKIEFNPETEKIIDDPIASRMLGRPMRSPYHL